MKIHSFWWFVLMASALCAGRAYAAQPMAAAGAPAKPGGSVRLPAPVSDSRLLAIRGGFDIGTGVVASFGISRAVYINGALVASTSLNIPNLSNIDAAQANALAQLVGGVTLVHNGPGNFVDPDAFNRAIGAIVIQNTLSAQQIQALTTINATVRNLGQFNSLNLGNSLQQALVSSRGQ